MSHRENGNDSLEIAHSENGDSTSSELERLQNVSPCPSGSDSPTERGIAKTRKEEDIILKLIKEANVLGSNTLDLSHKGMRQFPSEILEMPQIENLYLEGNELRTLPDELFDKLPNLKWLDLRRNYLIRLPSVYTGRHQNLRNLLLEGNNLRTLPLELGLIKTLNGLNITNNPLEFPPVSVVEKGISEILKFLREMLQAKSSGKLLNGNFDLTYFKRNTSAPRSMKLKRHKSLSAGHSDTLSALKKEKNPHPHTTASAGGRVRTGLRRVSAHSGIKAHSARLAAQQFPLESAQAQADIEEVIQEDDADESSSSDDDWNDDGDDLREYAYRQVQQRSMSTEAARKAMEKQMEPMHRSAELHRPQSYLELKQSKKEKLKKAGAMGTVDKYRKPQSATSVLDWKVNHYPEPPSQDYVDFKMSEERKMNKMRELKEKTDAILQRRRDEEMLKGWRDETKKLKQKKYFESLRKGTKDFLDPVQLAPFDIDSEYLHMPTNEERIKQDVKSAHEKLRKQLSPASRQRMEEEKAQRILQLEKRIKQHTAQMHERRKMPKGTPQEEMEAAKRELEVDGHPIGTVNLTQHINTMISSLSNESLHSFSAEALHRELMAKRKDLEYRFRAFVADIPTVLPYSRSTGSVKLQR